MKTVFFITICMISYAFGQVPKAPHISDFTAIKAKNPFNKLPVPKPPPERGPVEEEPKEKFILKGASRLTTGWSIQVANEKSPGENIYVNEGQKNDEGIKVVKVTRGKPDYLKTKVEITVNGEKQTITYNEKFLKAQTPRPKQPQVAKAKLPPGIGNPPAKTDNKDNKDEKETIPRRRIIRVKPKDSSNNSSGGERGGDRNSQ